VKGGPDRESGLGFAGSRQAGILVVREGRGNRWGGMRVQPFAEPVRLLFHLPEGYTRVLPKRFEGMGLTDGSIGWDIPTAAIPSHLRGIGSRFFVIGQHVFPEEHDTVDEPRAAARLIRVTTRAR
jgi:hypothetical protein